MGITLNIYALLDSLPLECDGMTRVVSTLLQKEGIGHRVNVGALRIATLGDIAHHWWISFPDGRICDFRARMWLGMNALIPHGIFTPTPQSASWYVSQHNVPMSEVLLSPVIFEVLTGHSVVEFPSVKVLIQNEQPLANQGHTFLCQTDQSL